MAVDEDDDEDARDEDGSIANSDALETRRRRTRDDDDGTTTTRTTTTMDARMRRARREHEKIARTYAEAHENVGTRENGTTRVNAGNGREVREEVFSTRRPIILGNAPTQ